VAGARADDLSDLGGDRNEWLCRMKAAHYDPHLRAAVSSHMAAVERAIAEALAQRLGTDPDQDPYPVLLAATGTGVLRAAMTFWARTGGTVGLDRLTEVAFAALAGGLAEDCALRTLAGAGNVSGNDVFSETRRAAGVTGPAETALLTDTKGKDNSR
jgi:hypothetical protein